MFGRFTAAVLRAIARGLVFVSIVTAVSAGALLALSDYVKR